MKNIFSIKKVFAVTLPLLLLFLGFLINEDLSTGGSKLDFYQTFPVVDNFAKNIFDNFDKYTRHFPLHYFLLSIPHFLFDDIFVTRIFYLIFASITPFLIYINLQKLYRENSYFNLIISFTIIFIPYFRASVIWPNAHLTAIIFLLISNYFFLAYQDKKKKSLIFLNIFFLALATYSIQSYAIFFLFYLFEYYKKMKLINFFYILFMCSIFSIPGFYLILKTPLGAKLDFTENFSYTILTNLSIVFFFILFFLFNKKTFEVLKNFVKNIKLIEIIIFSLIFFILLINYKNFTPGVGGGFFYKISFFLFKSELIFFIVSFLSIFILFFIFKNDKKLFFLLILINFTSTAYYTSQKYFEPLLIIVVLVMIKNFLTQNTIKSSEGVFKFYIFVFLYYILALVNNYLNLSNSLIY
tara:strand:- start:854 stop:2086 length:1233 start_codon:yes stop_codon:yes gene_type:complete